MTTANETREITNSDDVIDVRDVIARFEELDNLKIDGDVDDEQVEEWSRLKSLLSDLEGNGGDEQWRGSWYPITLVRDSYFEDFARDEAEQLGLIKSDMSWPYTCINWEKAAEQLQQDYSSISFDGVDYWYR